MWENIELQNDRMLSNPMTYLFCWGLMGPNLFKEHTLNAIHHSVFPLGWWDLLLFLCLLTGIAAATMFMPEKQIEVSETQLRVAFDGDAVLFSDESERIFKAHGLDKFFEHERENENRLLDHVCGFIVTHLSCLYLKAEEQMQNACLKVMCVIFILNVFKLVFKIFSQMPKVTHF